jgi:hypothetical protein
MVKKTFIQNNWSGNIKIMDKNRELNIKVNITVPEFSHGQNLNNLLQKNNLVMPVELQAMDIIMRNGPRLCKVALGSNFFYKYRDQRSRNTIFEIGISKGKDSVIPDPVIYGQFGHYQSARKCEGGLYFNIDRAMAIFSYGGSLFECIQDILESDEVYFNASSKKLVEEKIKGIFLISYKSSIVFN